LAPAAQAGQGQMWVLTGGDDQVHTWRLVLDHKGESIVNRSGVNDVVVIEDEKEFLRDGVNFVEQSGQNRFDWWLRRLEHT
jgi:hypothetical protein